MNSEAVLFPLGTTVYHKTDDDPGLVTAIVFRQNGVCYDVTWLGRVREEHEAIELTLEKNFAGSASSKKDE